MIIINIGITKNINRDAQVNRKRQQQRDLSQGYNSNNDNNSSKRFFVFLLPEREGKM